MEKSLICTNEKVSNYIPDDIVFSILSKLPRKSFKRFECVHKSWSLLFQNHHFINMFRINLFSNTRRCSYYDGASLLLKVYEHYKYDIYSLSGDRFQSKVKLDCSNRFPNDDQASFFGFGSINGTFYLYEDRYDGEIVLWNPATQTFKLLPPSTVVESVESSDDAEDFVSLTVNYNLNGFGYDDLTNDYKVIRYVFIVGEHAGHGCMSLEEMRYGCLHPFWEIYSLKSNSWKELDADMPSSLYYIEGTQVYMDGVCHWVSLEDNPDERYVVSFYLSNEVSFITPIPSDDAYFVFDDASWINLVVLNGFIVLITYHKYTTFHISILGEFGMKESWTKLLTVGPLPCIQRPIGVGTNGEIFFIRKDQELVWLDLSNQMTMELGYKVVGDSSRIIIYKEKHSACTKKRKRKKKKHSANRRNK